MMIASLMEDRTDVATTVAAMAAASDETQILAPHADAGGMPIPFQGP